MTAQLDVVLVTLDSFRADHVGEIGEVNISTPNIDAFADGATTYRSAMAHGPSTYLSFPSLLTGNHALTNPNFPYLSASTIQEHLSSQGYHTMAAVGSNAWLSPTYNYDRGFDEFNALGRGPRTADSWWDHARHHIGDNLGNGVLFRVVKSAYDRLRNATSEDRTEEEVLHDLTVEHVSREEPTFTWVHYMTSHAPYIPDPDGPAILESVPAEDEQRSLIERARKQPEAVPDRDRELLRDLYREAIVHVDRRIGELVDEVDLNETAVVLTADHGEAFWDHGYFEHPPELHQELLHVPLIVSSPDEDRGNVVDNPIGLESVPELLTDLANVESFASDTTAPNERLFAAVAHDSHWEPQSASVESLQVAVRDEQWKYVHRVMGDDDLFDLSSNPDETDDVVDEYAAVTEELLSAAVSFRESLSLDGNVEIPDELKDHLQDLGYMR